MPFSINVSPVQAQCNMESGYGGWAVLVRRTPDVDELRQDLGRNTRMDYGLKNMHCLTSPEPMEVEVELSKINATKLVLSYNYGQLQVKG